MHHNEGVEFEHTNHLAGSGGGSETLLAGLFVLLSFFEERLRHFNSLMKGWEISITSFDTLADFY